MSSAATTGAGAAREWDAVVVGAGPAGSLAAHELARRGHSVLLVDKAAFPRGKVCGCCLNRSALEALDRVGLGQAVAELGGTVLESLVLVAERGRRAELPLAGGRALSRSALDHALVRAAVAAGADFRPGRSARVGECDGAFRIVRVGEASARARVVIVADGLAGTALSELNGFEPRIARASRIGVGAIFDAPPGPFPAGAVTMVYGRHGYVGAVHLEDGRFDIAAAVDPAWMKAAGGPGAAVSGVFAAAGIEADLSNAEWRGTPPLTRRRRVEAERLLIVGDAAGYIEPFTGEGMAWAMTGGVAAAEHAGRLIRRELVRESWSATYRTIVQRGHRECRVLSGVLQRPWMTRMGISVLASAPLLARPVIRRLSHSSP